MSFFAMRTSVNERKTLKTRLATLTIRNLPRKCRKKDGHRDYLKYVRSIIPAKVVLAYTSDISKDRQRIEKERREFGSSSNLGALSAGRNGVSQRTNDESGISWGEVFKLITDLATIAKFALKF